MKLNFIILLFLGFKLISAQDLVIPPTPLSKEKFTWGLSGSIDYCNRVLFNSTDDPQFDDFIKLRYENENATLGFSAGLAFKIPIAANSNLITGLRFSRSGNQSKCFDDLHWPSENNNGQWVPNDSAADISIQYFYRSYYIDLPILFQVFTNAEKHKWFFITGFSTNFSLKETTTSVVTENGDTRKSTRKQDNDYAFMNITPEISFGREIILNNTLALQIAPTFRYGLFPIEDAVISPHLWSIGLNMVCYWRGSRAKEL